MKAIANRSGKRLFLVVFLPGLVCCAGMQAKQACGAGDAPPAEYCSAKNVETAVHDNRAIRLARRWKVILQERFDRGIGAWKVRNFGNRMTIKVAEAPAAPASHRCVLVTRRGEKTDTAVELLSRQVPVTPKTEYRLTFITRHDVDLMRTRGHKEYYWNRIIWLGQDGKRIATTPFNLGPAGQSWQKYVVEATSPEGAASAQIQIGFDAPNLHDGNYVMLTDITLNTRMSRTFESEGQLVSRPLHVAGLKGLPELRWQADVPAGTTIRFQVRSGTNAIGDPKTWTPFCGPDGMEKSYYTQSGTVLPPIHGGHEWFQYRVRLSTRKPGATPLLREVTIGRGEHLVTDRRWTAPDTTPPALVRYRPTRTTKKDGPIIFSLADNPAGVGINRNTIEVTLDNESITPRLKIQPDGSLRYDLDRPLDWTLPALEAWTIRNYEDALEIVPAEGRAPGRPDSLRITRKGARTNTAFYLLSPKIPVQGGAKYKVSYWSRHSVRVGKASHKPGKFSAGVQWLDGRGRSVGAFIPFDFGDANPRWHQDRYVLTAPQGARFARMSLGWEHPNMYGGAEAAFAEPAFDGHHPARENLINLHLVTVKAGDFAGNALRHNWWILVAPPPKEGIVTVRDDGVVVVDGRPFFPIGMYGVWKRKHNQNDLDKCFTELAAAGFNTAHTFHWYFKGEMRKTNVAEFYAAAHRHGIKVFLASNMGENSTDIRGVLHDVVRECFRPALLAWYPADVTSKAIGPAELRRVHQAIKDVDPYHITMQADCVCDEPGKSYYAAYVNSTDGFLPLLYPVLSDAHDDIAKVICDMKTVASDLKRTGQRKPVWAVVQAFKGWGWRRYPTSAEVRAMTYLSIIHGATGVIYYTYDGHGKNNYGATDNPKLWANVKRIAGELARLHDVLVQRDPPQSQRVQIISGRKKDGYGYPSISTLLKRHNGRMYLLTANSAEAKVCAKFSAKEIGKTVQVMFEDRKVQVRAGAFEDEFGPYAVHIYSWQD